MWKKVPLAAALFFCLARMLPAQQICINEFMAVPLAGEAEWIELYNLSAQTVRPIGWTLEDRTGRRIVLEDAPPLPPGGFLLVTEAIPAGSRWSISADSIILLPSLPSLNNSGDDIVLRNAGGAIVDSLHYTASWLGAKGVSLERVRPEAAPEKENWRPSMHADGATPAAPNSVLPVELSPIPPGALRINEIMYEPLSGGCEWVEVLYRGADSLAISRLMLAVAAGSGMEVFPLSTVQALPPDTYLLVAADSSLLTRFPRLLGDTSAFRLCVLQRSSLGLGNDGDAVVLRDSDGSVLDSVQYLPAWHHPFVADSRGRSLERLHPDMHAGSAQSWSSSPDPDGATPGRRNGVYAASWQQDLPAETALRITPVPFSPDGDGYEDFCSISCRAGSGIHQARLRIYDMRGRLLRTLLSGTPMGERLDVIWDGLDASGRRVRIGPYVALLDLLDTADNAVSSVKGIIVVAKKL